YVVEVIDHRVVLFFFSSRRRHTRSKRDWSSDVCSSDLIIVSNPPYIAYEEADQLEEIVRNYDPELALFADKQGLFAYEQIIKQSSYVLNKKGSIFFEIGHTQAAPVVRLIQEQFPESDIEVFQDINGKDRIVSAVLT